MESQNSNANKQESQNNQSKNISIHQNNLTLPGDCSYNHFAASGDKTRHILQMRSPPQLAQN